MAGNSGITPPIINWPVKGNPQPGETDNTIMQNPALGYFNHGAEKRKKGLANFFEGLHSREASPYMPIAIGIISFVVLGILGRLFLNRK